MKPLNKLREEIVLSEEKHHVMTFGRLSPPTTGHAKLVDKVKEIAKHHKADHTVILSHTHDGNKNPLSKEQKLKHAKRFFPHTNLETSSKESPSLLHHAKKLHDKGVTHLHVVAGSDRVPEYKKLFHKYNGKHEGAQFNFKKIHVHSAGERDPDAEGTEGMSASKMRHHAKHDNFKEFKKGIPHHVSDEHAKEMFHDVKHGIKEELDYFDEGVNDRNIFKAVFMAGGPGSGKDYVIKKVISGTGLVEISSDPFLSSLLVKAGLDLKMPDNQATHRNVLRARAKNIENEKRGLAISGRLGIILNSTAWNIEDVRQEKKELEALGYDTMMIFVYVSDDISRQRNVERGLQGGRSIPEKHRQEKWQAAFDVMHKYEDLFGKDKFSMIDNSKDFRFATPEEVAHKEAEYLKMYKKVTNFLRIPPHKEEAKTWMKKQRLGSALKEDQDFDELFEDYFERDKETVDTQSSPGGVTRYMTKSADTASPVKSYTRSTKKHLNAIRQESSTDSFGYEAEPVIGTPSIKGRVYAGEAKKPAKSLSDLRKGYIKEEKPNTDEYYD